MKARFCAVILLLLASAALHARDLFWYVSLGAGAGAVLPSGGYMDFMGQELANQEGHAVFLMGPAASLAAHCGIGFLPWLGIGLDLGASLGVPLSFGDASAWILYAPSLSAGAGPDLAFGLDDSVRLRVSPRLGVAFLPFGLWEGSSFGGLSSIEHESWRGAIPSLTGLLRFGLEGGGKTAWLLFLEGAWNFTSLLNPAIWGGGYQGLALTLGAGISWNGRSEFRPKQRPPAEDETAEGAEESEEGRTAGGAP